MPPDPRMYPPRVIDRTRIDDLAAITVGYLANHLARPQSGVWLKSVIDLDVRWLAYIRSTTNIQGRWPKVSPTSRWEPLWSADHIEALNDQLDKTLRVFRASLHREPVTMLQRRAIILDTLFQVARSLAVGLSWDEGLQILERWLISKGRRPSLYYRTALSAIHRRMEALNEEDPSTRR